MSRARTERREEWRRLEKLSRKGGDPTLDRQVEFFLPCKHCGESQVYAPPVMSKAILETAGFVPVAVPTHCDDVVYRTNEGFLAVICASCHASAVMTEPEGFGFMGDEDDGDFGSEGPPA